MIMGGYWPSWAEMTPEDIDWSLFDLMAFAFATPTTTGGVSIDTSDAALLKRLVAAGHAGDAKVIVSLGGWDNGQGFSPSVSTAALRQTFATSILNFMTTYNLDGVDLDWEYPNSAYATNYDSADAANFQTFLQTLRATLGADAIITAAVSDETWISSTGGTVSNVARAAGALSYIMIMNYDVWGESSTPGPNAPLADLCGNSTQPSANAEAAVKQWYAAGMPKKKMLLGVPYYGYVQSSTKTTLIQRSLGDEPADEALEAERRVLKNRALGGRPRRSDDPRLSQSEPELERRKTSLSTGQMNFNEIFANGAIKRGTGSNTGTYVAGSGWTKYWDDCSDTPYLSSGNQVITYDDPASLYDKAYFARQSGLGGTSMWSVDGDTTYWNLTLAMRSGMGI
jgi:chitinase